VNRILISAALLAIAGVVLAGCIDSAGPILTDSQQAFGPQLRLQLYTLDKGYAREPVRATFTWNGTRYEHTSGGMRETSAFSVHPFEAGDYIIQGLPRKRPSIREYALAHKLAGGVFQVLAIDEDDADEQTRATFCGKGSAQNPAACRIKTRDQLFAFARATAARRRQDGGLALLLPPESAKPNRHRR
jgi:hypothetical protein